MSLNNKRNRGLYLLTLSVLVGMLVVTSTACAAAGLTKIAEGVYCYVDTKGMTLQNGYGANVGVIVGGDGIAVIDTRASAKEAQRLIRDIRAISDKPIRYVVNTHYHFDHTFGNSEFAKLGATIIAHSTDAASLKKTGETALNNLTKNGLSEYMQGTYVAPPNMTFENKMAIDLGGIRLELLYLGPAHTAGNIVAYLPESKILFTGDVLFADSHPNLSEGNLDGWQGVLKSILLMDVGVMVPGHGRLADKKDVTVMGEYLKVFDANARELCAQSKDIKFIVAEMKKVLPQWSELESLIEVNIKRRYFGKS